MTKNWSFARSYFFHLSTRPVSTLGKCLAPGHGHCHCLGLSDNKQSFRIHLVTISSAGPVAFCTHTCFVSNFYCTVNRKVASKLFPNPVAPVGQGCYMRQPQYCRVALWGSHLSSKNPLMKGRFSCQKDMAVLTPHSESTVHYSLDSTSRRINWD